MNIYLMPEEGEGAEFFRFLLSGCGGAKAAAFLYAEEKRAAGVGPTSKVDAVSLTLCLGSLFCCTRKEEV